jgi:glycosyltransferase involved in cell wall biosynthesis
MPEIAKRLAYHRNVKFLLIGSGPIYESVKNLSKGLPIEFTGSLSDREIPEILASSDILIAPFDASGYNALETYGFWFCPVKLFEYMASGKAIVSFGYKEVKRIIRDAGLLAEPNNLNEFINKIEMLIEDGKLRRCLGSKARKIAEKEYSWKRRAEQTIDVYNKVLDSP